MKLYQMLTEKQLSKFLREKFNKDFNELQTTELKKEPLFGDFIIWEGYYFKKVYSQFQCMQTPTDKHVPKTIATAKNPNDSLRWR